MNWAKTAAVLALAATGASADADLSRFRPIPRPADLAAPVTPPAEVADDLSRFHPLPRPDFSAVAEAEPKVRPQPRPDMTVVSANATGVRPQPRPNFTPAKPEIQPDLQLAAQPLAPPAKPEKPAKGSLKGSVCQSADLKGKTLPPIRSAIKGCNVPDAVLVSQVSGVVLNPPATINCEEARALSVWVKNGLQPAFNNQILALNVVDSYACRPRNNVRGNPVSVHGLGQAIDISGFVTKTGRTYTVAQNYNAQIRAAQKAGCGTFHTILGPGSDGYHENHIHFDVAKHRGRDYCR